MFKINNRVMRKVTDWLLVFFMAVIALPVFALSCTCVRNPSEKTQKSSKETDCLYLFSEKSDILETQWGINVRMNGDA